MKCCGIIDAGGHGLLHRDFEAQVRLRPKDCAIITGDKAISFLELNRAACHIGQWVRSQGGGRGGPPVAVLIPKGWEQVAAAIGILKAGAPYLPVDPGLPPERIRLMLECRGISLFIVTPASGERVPAGKETNCLIVSEKLLAGKAEELSVEGFPEDPAYVMFTSGSTGQPKGVVSTHAGALNTVRDINRIFQVGNNDRLLVLSGFYFDLSVYDIFGLLGAGGALIYPSPEAREPVGEWAELVETHRVTLWNSVPSLWRRYVDYLLEQGRSAPGSLKTVLLSGDRLPVKLAAITREHFPGIGLANLYGVTEASIWSLYFPVNRVDPAWNSIPIGKPMVNQQVYVLDETFKPCAPCVPGDIYISGAGLAVGYWGEQGLTDHAFFSHPATGERLYRTGDRGRYLADGAIEFLGRLDNQVKINGDRIELDEINSALVSHEAVYQARTVVRGVEERPFLVTCFVPRKGCSVDIADLFYYLRSKLPAYMVPERILALEAFPMNQNGKIDVSNLARDVSFP